MDGHIKGLLNIQDGHLTDFQSLMHLQSGPEPQKTVKFAHSIISLNQLLRNSKNTANIFLTFRNHVKRFLSRNIVHNFKVFYTVKN